MVRLVALAFTGMLCAGSGVAHAADGAASSDAPSMTLRDAVERVLDRNARIRGLDAERDAARARADAVALAPAFAVGVDVENVAGTGDTSGVDALEATLSLAGTYERGGKRARRVDLSRAEFDALDAAQRLERLDLAALVARRFVDLVAAQSRLGLARDAADLVERTLDTVRVRAAAGRASRADVARTEIALGRARIEVRDAQSDARTARTALAALWGGRDWEYGDAAGDLYRLPAVAPLETLVARLEASPELEALAARTRVEEARQRLAEAARRSDVDWSAGVRHLEAGGDQAFVFGIRVPIGSDARARPVEREADAQRRRLELEHEAHALDLHAALFAAREALGRARDRFDSLDRELLPLGEEALRHAEAGYASGRYSLLELGAVRTELLDLRRERLDTAAAFHQVLIETQRLADQPVVESLAGE